MTLKITHQSRSLSIDSPFADKVQLRNLEGSEYISGLFRFNLTLVSDDFDLDFTKIVGKHATVGLLLEDESERYIDGIVTHFSHAGQGEDGVHYHAVIQPWLWQLTLGADCRIYQKKSVPEILEELFGELGFSDFEKELQGTYDKRDYCVQYMESCFDFVSRLMEEEGIFYFFTFDKGVHTMVLADDPSAHKDVVGQAKAKFRVSQDRSSRSGTIPQCSFRECMTTGAFAYNDYNFEAPKEKLLAKAKGKGSDMEQYHYPGGYTVKGSGEKLAKKIQEAWEQPGAEFSGSSFAPAFCAGFKFAMEEHPRKALNQAYVIKTVRHSASPEQYSNGFSAFPADRPYRAPLVTPKARIYGAQTAVVVGKSGEEIWTDKYGRIKVQFHWDRLGKKDENSSCWIRVAQGWAGKQWGAFFLPRIGQEVLVTFLDGDPDRPLVTGSVYNADQTVPYSLPDNQTQSTMKSNSSKGGAGFNELRFEDKKDSEEIFMHAQKDMNTTILNDKTMTITANRVTTIKEGNETFTLEKGDRELTITKGKETHSVKGTREVTVEGDETHTNKGNFTHEVKGNYTLKVTGDILIDAKGVITIKGAKDIKGTAGMAITLKSGTDFKAEAGTNMSLKAGIELKSEGTMVTNKASAMGTVDGGGMLTVKGGMVMIN